MPINQDSNVTMFLDRPWNVTQMTEYCASEYQIALDKDFVMTFYGGRKLSDFYGYSNIFFSNGNLDPWSAGSPNSTVSKVNWKLTGYKIHGSAHHLDLRSPNPKDPQGVIDCRNLEIKCIKIWLSGRSVTCTEENADALLREIEI